MIIWDFVKLKEMQESDLSLVLSWRNQEFIRKLMYNSAVISKEEHVEWFNKIQKQNTSEALVFYFNNKPYGVINIHNINTLNGTCDWGFYIGEKDAPSGLGKILGYLGIQFIFYELNMRKICAEVLEFNKKSYFFHKKIGFDEEGILKEQIYKEGKYIDVILFGLLEKKWSVFRDKLKKEIEMNAKKF